MASISKEEKQHLVQPLLQDSNHDYAYSVDSEQATSPSIYPEHPSRRQLYKFSWWHLHTLLAILYSTVFIAFAFPFFQLRCVPSSPRLPLPAREALKPQLRYFPTSLEENEFAGAPRLELHEAWHDLLQNDNIRLPKASIEALGLSSIYVRDSSEGIASLSVYHALHCVKNVREMMYKGHYHAGKTEVQLQREIKHADHCIEYLRESLMCKPDLSLVTFRWINETAQHPNEPEVFYPTNFDAGLHECANWEALDNWAAERVFDLYDVELLDRPEPWT